MNRSVGRMLGLAHVDDDTLRRWFHGLAQSAINFEDDPAKWAVADATGAEISRELAAVFDRLFAEPTTLRLDPDRPPVFRGWEFRAPRHLHVRWDP